MVYTLRVLMVVCATAVAFAAPAAADEEDYLRTLQPQFSFLSAEQLLSEGARVCEAIRGGAISPDAVVMVTKDLGVSISAAGDIVSAAVAQLGC